MSSMSCSSPLARRYCARTGVNRTATGVVLPGGRTSRQPWTTSSDQSADDGEPGEPVDRVGRQGSERLIGRWTERDQRQTLRLDLGEPVEAERGGADLRLGRRARA